MKNMQLYIGLTLLVLFLLFYPCSVNGKLQFNGIRGCATGQDSALEGRNEIDWKKELQHGNILGLIKW